MDEDRASTVRGWRSRSVEGYAGLHGLAGEEFSGVIETDRGSIRAFMTNGKVVGIAGGDVDDLDGAAMTAYAAPGDAIPLLFAMQARGGDPRAQYYTEETPLSEVNDTLEQGGFTGYVELSENVLSGDYYVVYHGGRSSSVAFVGNAPRLLTDEEAFERAADEVGIYTVYDVGASVIDLPGGEAVERTTNVGGAVGGGDATEAADAREERAAAADPADGREAGPATDGPAGIAEESDDAGPPARNAADADGGGNVGTAADTDPATDDDGSSGREDRSIRGVGGVGATSGSSSSGTGPYSGGEEIRVGAGLGLDDDGDENDAEDEGEDHPDAAEPADEDADGPDVPDADGSDVPDADGSDVPDTGEPDESPGADTGEPNDGAGSDDAAAPGSDDHDPGDDADGVATTTGESVDASTDEGHPTGTAAESPADDPVDGDAPDPAADETGEAAVDRGDATSAGHPEDGTSVDPEPGGVDPATDVAIGSVDGARTDPADDASVESTDDGSIGRPDEGSTGRTDEGTAGSVDDAGTDAAATRAGGPAADDPASGAGTTPASVGDDDGGSDPRDRNRLETELDDVRDERDRIERELREARDELDRVRAERDDYRAEAERLQERIETLEARVETLEAGSAAGGVDAAGDATERSLSPAEALAGTNLFVRYGSKADPTLETAHGGDADPETVNGNLRIERHTRFESEDVVVDGEPFESFLTSTFEYRFAEWVIRGLLYELRSTGNQAEMERLYDAIPAIDRIQFGGEVAVGGGTGEEASDAREFDVIFRDGMGGPLLVANLHESRDPTAGGAVTTLIEDARSVAVTAETVGASFVVTRSYYEPPALEAASDATGGGFLSRSRYESYVKMDRKRGFHLCLVEARDGEFNLRIPEL